ncbi:MAG: TldD/PmbA family protein [Firmicutes bacterium]|nr:TldD/PmbA family protein [Bacillota bacterium]
MLDLLKRAVDEFVQAGTGAGPDTGGATGLTGAGPGAAGYVEIRYHRRLQTVINVRNGILKRAEQRTLAGAAVRCLVDGSWGFISTSDVSEEGLRRALAEARAAARLAAALRQEKVILAPAPMGKGEFFSGVPAPAAAGAAGPAEPSLDQKIRYFMQAEEKLRKFSSLIAGSNVQYTEYRDTKFIVNTDGAAAHLEDCKRSVHILATALREGERETGQSNWGVTGAWEDLLAKQDVDQAIAHAADLAIKKLDAGHPKGGVYTVVLDPGLVGVLAHEAIGHTVEADFVLSGSVVKGKIGQKVASDLVTLVDDGTVAGAAGEVLVDDEGVQGRRTVIIENGVLKSYLHNRESAHLLGAEPHGNARAFTYRDEPIIRMTNTFILPGEDRLEDMLAGIQDGYYLKDLGQGGQADATAEFMFSVAEAYRIKDGQIGEMVKGVTISGQAFDVLQSVDAVSGELEFKMGAGHCGKWQPAKVDGGGPHIRCRVTVGGR